MDFRIQICIVLSGLNCVPNSLAGHQLIWTLGRFNLWKQVQKTERIVDFTILGAKIDRVHCGHSVVTDFLPITTGLAFETWDLSGHETFRPKSTG